MNKKIEIDLLNLTIILMKNSHLRTKRLGPWKSNLYLQSCLLTFSVSRCSHEQQDQRPDECLM